jgi:hypothetical protein
MKTFSSFPSLRLASAFQEGGKKSAEKRRRRKIYAEINSLCLINSRASDEM